MNFVVPFIVSNLGLLSGRSKQSARPGTTFARGDPAAPRPPAQASRRLAELTAAHDPDHRRR